jgi:hypothetical protein
MIGESGDRVPSAVVPPAATATPYRVSNGGRPIEPKEAGRQLFDGHPYTLFLLGTRDGIAFYRLRVTAHFTCWGTGDASSIGRVRGFGCPKLVGASPLQNEGAFVHIDRGGKLLESPRIVGIAVDEAKSMALLTSGGRQIATTPVADNLYAFPRPYPKEQARVVALDAAGNELRPHPEWGRHQTPPKNLFAPRATRVDAAKAQIGHVVQPARSRGVTASVGDR